MSPLQLTGLPLGPWCLGELTPVPDLLPSLPISPPAWTHLCSILAPGSDPGPGLPGPLDRMIALAPSPLTCSSH